MAKVRFDLNVYIKEGDYSLIYEFAEDWDEGKIENKNLSEVMLEVFGPMLKTYGNVTLRLAGTSLVAECEDVI